MPRRRKPQKTAPTRNQKMVQRTGTATSKEPDPPERRAVPPEAEVRGDEKRLNRDLQAQTKVSPKECLNLKKASRTPMLLPWGKERLLKNPKI